MRYNLSRSLLLGFGIALLSNFFSIGEIHAATTISVYEYAEVATCSIPAGSSTCTATTVVYGPSGLTYSITNLTRGVTSANILTPNNYILYGTAYAYVLRDSVGDAANKLTYGANDLTFTKPGTNVASLKAVGTATCATGSTWNGQICATPNPPAGSGSMASIVTISTGNGDTTYTYDLPRDISKNFYNPDQVTKIINIPSTTSVLNIALSSAKERCSISPSYTTDTGISFSSNAKDYLKPDTKSITYMLPTYGSIISTSGINTLFGKISAISMSCDNTNDFVKDFIILKVSFGTTLPPVVPTEIQATGCTIASGKSTCMSTVTVTPPPTKYFSLENSTRGVIFPNAFSPGVGSLSTSSLGEQAANYLTFGANTLNLKDGGAIVSSVQTSATCATGTTWNGQMCIPPKLPPVACTMEVRYCDDQSIMPRDPNTCEWLPAQCPPVTPATSIILTHFIINDFAYNYAGSLINVNDTDKLSLRGQSRPGASIYFYRDGQSIFDSTVTGINGEWNFTNIWSPAGAKVVIPGEYLYKVSGLPPNSQSLIYSPVVDVRVKVASTSPTVPPPTSTGGAYNVILEAKNCTILAGMNTCAATVSVTSTKYIGTTGGRMFDLKNATRNLTSVNLFTPNNTALNSLGYPVYTVTTSTTGDAANYAKYGVNDLALIEGGVTVAKATMTASCASGSTWNGQICTSAPVTPPPTQSGGVGISPVNPYAKMTTCIIPVGQSTCSSTLLIFAQSGQIFSVKNITRNVTSSANITPNNYYVLAGKSVYVSKGSPTDTTEAQQLTLGVNNLTITRLGILPVSFKVRVIARCEVGSSWDGTKCITKVFPVFAVQSYETAQGVKTITSSGITFDPVLDKFLTLRGVGPYGKIEMLQGGSNVGIVSSFSVDSSGKWNLTLNATNTPQAGSYNFVIWDGKSTTTSTTINMTIKEGVAPGTIGKKPTPSQLPVVMVTR